MQRRIKRLIDICISGFLLVILSPLFILIAVIIKVTSPGSVLYRWPVVGKDGQPLRSYKFRTMVVNAEALKKQLFDQNEATGPIFKMKQDPRVTPVGRILRKFSLDELPQLWNILKGDMSLVGPRPVLVSEWEQFNDWQRQKLSIKPGAVCLWHINGQPRDIDEWIKMDLEYIENWTLGLDLKIFAGTIRYILSGKNY